jgi:hypothetical protein
LPTDWQVTRDPASYRAVTPWTASSGQVQTSVDRVVTSYPLNPANSENLFNCYETLNVNDRAIGVRPRPNTYSSSIMVRVINDYNYQLTGFTVEYLVEKYWNDTNADGTNVKLYLTTNPSPSSFSETNTDPATGWVGYAATEQHYGADATNTNPNSGYPLTTTLVSTSITGISIAPNQVFYLAVNFSIGDPTNSGGNRAQNAQCYALDEFSIVNPLPVELTSFSAKQGTDGIQLAWRTATEMNNYGFEIERTVDGASWENIGFVAGAGTTNSPREYSYVDATRFDGINVVTYRLRQIDRDGSSSYSSKVAVSLATDISFALSNFPNPFNPSTTLQFTLTEQTPVTLTIRDAAGREVARLFENATLGSGKHSVSFNASSLPSGIYFSVLQAGSQVTSSRMTLTK